MASGTVELSNKVRDILVQKLANMLKDDKDKGELPRKKNKKKKSRKTDEDDGDLKDDCVADVNDKNNDIPTDCKAEKDSDIEKSSEVKLKKKKKKKEEKELTIDEDSNKDDSDSNDEQMQNIPEKDYEKFNGILNQMDTSKLTKVKQHKRKIKTTEESNDTHNCADSGRKQSKKDKTQDLAEEEQKIEDNPQSAEISKEKVPGIEYLLQWKNEKKNWKFKKVRQTWLLRHIYDESKLSRKEFKIMLKYLNELKGKAKEETLTKATEISEKEADENEDEEPISESKKRRALEIVRILS